MIWLGKQYLGQSDKASHRISGQYHEPVREIEIRFVGADNPET